MKNNVLVHIGYHRTGSTFLQKEVFTHPDLPFNLVERGHVEKEIIKKNLFFFDADVIASFLNEKFTDSGINVISEEHLAGNPHTGGYNGYDNFLKIKLLFPDAKILICIREQNDIILSGYKQYTKTIGTLPLKRYLLQVKRGNYIPVFNLGHFCYDKLIDTYIKAFGREKVLVLPYELLKVNPHEYLTQIFEFLELDINYINKINFQKKINSAELNIVLELKRIYNILFTKTRASPHGLLSLPTRMDQPLFKFISFFESRLGKNFQKKINQKQLNLVRKISKGFYTESNRKTSELINIDLGLYGYEV